MRLYVPNNEKDWPDAYWKRVKIFDPENFGCIMSETKNSFTMIDYLVDTCEETVSIVHVCGPMPQIRTLLNILLVDKDVKKCVKERWENVSHGNMSIDCRCGMTGHRYYTFSKWSTYHIRKFENYEIDETSSGKLNFQSFAGSVPIWVLIAADYDFWRKSETKDDSLTYYETVMKRNRKMLKSHLRKDNIKIQYTPGYRYRYLEYKKLNEEGKIFTI